MSALRKVTNLAIQRLSALQEELSGIEETEAEMAEIMKHVDAPQGILGSTKKPKLSFSSVSRSQLTELGLKRIPFLLNDVGLDARIATSSIDSKHTDALCLQITRIHRSTSKRFKAGARMTLHAILLTIADISLDAKEKLPVAIFPQMRIASGDGVLVKNTVNQLKCGSPATLIMGSALINTRQIAVLEASLDDLMRYTGNCIMLVEAKHDKEMLIDCMPEATTHCGQAIDLSEVTGIVCPMVPNGTIVQPHLEIGEDFKKDVQRLVELLYHWLRTASDGDIKNDPLCTV